MTFSAFTAHYTANRRFIPAAVAAQIRRDAIARVSERFGAGRADGVLDFSDMIQRIEAAIAP